MIRTQESDRERERDTRIALDITSNPYLQHSFYFEFTRQNAFIFANVYLNNFKTFLERLLSHWDTCRGFENI